MTDVQKMVQLFKDKRYLRHMSSKNISKRTHISLEDIASARKIMNDQKISVINNHAKILIFDIETTPLKAYVWRRWNQNIYLDQTISEWYMLSWSAKWLNRPEVMSEILNPYEISNEDDSRIIKKLWLLLDAADIVIAHNGKKFDVPKMNARFILNNLPPTSPYIQIDTREIAAKQFGFSSNKLDALAGYFNIEHKDETDFKLWSRCMKGDEESLNYMRKYNNKDVLILQQVYLKLRPWIKNHPNVGLYSQLIDYPLCPTCGGHHMVDDNSYYYTAVNKYKVMRCTNCNALARVRNTSIPKEDKKHVIVSI